MKQVIYLSHQLYLAITCFLVISITFFTNAHSESEHPGTKIYNEYTIKAAYIYNFLKLSSIADSVSKEILVCTFIDNQQFEFFKSLDKKNLYQKSIRVLHLQSIDNVEKCSVIYLSENFRHLAHRIFELTNNKPILTIGEDSNFIADGGMIRLFVNDGAVQYVVNQNQATFAGITLNSKLLIASITPNPTTTILGR
jgi:YfiR/HmsC-like